MDIKIIYRDNNLIVALKPAGMPVQPDKTGDMDMVSSLSSLCGLGVFPVHRLDRPVGGLIVFALSSRAAASLSNAEMKKTYRAVVCGDITPREGRLTDYLLKNARTNTSRTAGKSEKGAKLASLTYRTLETRPTEEGLLSLLEIRLETGRHHQIRVQLSSRGFPLWGDLKYNRSAGRYIPNAAPALFASGLSFVSPDGKTLEFTEMPDSGFPFDIFTN